jgi:hypothetical protein
MAAVLWIISIACLFKAIGGAITAEESLYNPHLTDTDHIAIHHLSEVADRWAAVGWILQFATATVLSFGLKSPRFVRRIFVSLGILIAADGITLLLVAIIAHV